jgi:hypothetical protein
MASKEWDKNRAVVWIAGIFTYGIVSLVRTVYTDGKPLLNVDTSGLKSISGDNETGGGDG